MAACTKVSTGRGARKSWDWPGSISAFALAAITAASSPSAMPTADSQPASSATRVTSASASASSEP